MVLGRGSIFWMLFAGYLTELAFLSLFIVCFGSPGLQSPPKASLVGTIWLLPLCGAGRQTSCRNYSTAKECRVSAALGGPCTADFHLE